MKSVNGRIERLERQAQPAGAGVKTILMVRHDPAESDVYRDEIKGTTYTRAELDGLGEHHMIVIINMPDNGRDPKPAGS